MGPTERNRELLEALHRPPTPVLTKAEASRYSLARAITALMSGNPRAAGFEHEVSTELARRYREPQHSNGLLIAPDAFWLQRDLNVAAADQGGYLTDTQNIGFVELARPRSVLLTLNATVVEGLTSNATIPRITTGAAVTWLGAEITQASEEQPELGQISLSPKSVSVYTEVSQHLTLQISPSAERLLRAELLGGIGQAVDIAGIAGSGASGEPLGIMNTPGIGSVSGTTFTRTGLLSMQANAGNALSQFGGYVAPLATAQLLAGREVVTDTGIYLWNGNLYQGELAGFPALSSNNVPTGRLLFGGDWSTVLVGAWGDAIEIAINPYANFPAGIVGLRVVHSIDIAVRQPAAFSATDTVT